MTNNLKLLVVIFPSLLSISCATEISTTPPFVAQLYVSQITRPRALLLDLAGDILVSSAESRITAIRETNHGNGTSTVETTTIVDGYGLGLNHGIAFHNGFLYASSAFLVYRWSYKPGQFSLINQNTRQIVVSNITQDFIGHLTRSLIFDDTGRLYITIGSLNNGVENANRSQIRRFNNLELQFLPIPFNNGEVFAYGCRNTVGLAFSSSGTLYGVDNSPAMLDRPDLGVDIWPENPAEELNKFSLPVGTHYGYPFCWSTYKLVDFPSGTQFAWHTFLNNGTHTDEWCQDINNNAPPILSMYSHSTPLALSFYDGISCGINGGFPCDAIDDAFVGFRGTQNQGAVNGYKVTWYPFNKEQELPTGEAIDVIYAPDATNSCNTCLRPAGVVFNKDGHLIVTGETTNEIFRVAYDTSLPVINNIYH